MTKGTVLKFGIFDHLDLGTAPASQTFEDRLALLDVYEQAGYHAFHLAEHHGTTLGIAASPSVFLAAGFQRTKRLRMGALSYIVSMYHPIRLIEEIGMLDHLSGGRLEVGIGRGVSPFEVGYFGVDPDDTPAMFREVLELFRVGFAMPTVSYEGKFYRYRDVPMILRPFQSPHPPIWYGVSRPESSEWAAENRLNVVSISPVNIVREASERYRAQWLKSGGSESDMPFIGLGRHVVVAPTDQEALAVARRAYPVWQESFVRLWRQHGRMPVRLQFPPRFDDAHELGFAVAGSPSTVRDWLKAQVTEANVTYFNSQFVFGDMRRQEAETSAKLFAQEVMPHLSV